MPQPVETDLPTLFKSAVTVNQPCPIIKPEQPGTGCKLLVFPHLFQLVTIRIQV